MYPAAGERVNHESITGADPVTGVMKSGMTAAVTDPGALGNAGSLGDAGSRHAPGLNVGRRRGIDSW